uniref:hypothetical protein n=1 Tax=Prevotella sp. TaxID=59823 RepID=UPI0040278794
MNDLTELKHTFVSSKTKLFAALTIFIFMIVGCLHAQAKNDNLVASIDNLDKLPGQKETNVKAAAISDNSFPEDDKSKIFFIYNVKTGLLLNTGGYWGTHVSLKEFGMPLWVHLDTNNYIHFAQKFDKFGAGAGEGNYLEYENKSKESDPDQGVYVDRSYISGATVTKRGWVMEAVSGKTGIYRLYTYLYSSNKFDTSKKYYLIAFDQQGDVDKNCGAVAEGSSDIKKASSSSETGNDEWKVITYQQIFDLQKNNAKNITKSLDLTFRLQCPGFSRENAALANWKTSKYGGEGQIRFGLEHYYKTPDENGNVNTSYVDDFSTSSTNHISSYKFPDGTDQRTFTSADDYERHCGKYYAADIKNAHGAIYQDITVENSGAYVVECKGFSNTTKAKLFAVVIKKTKLSDGTTQVENVKNTLRTTVLGQINYMSDAEKTALHTDEQNMDYGAKEFYGNHKYFSSVLVQVPDGGGTIRFGIEVGSRDDKTPGKGDDGNNEWTVFDDFRLLYASKTTDGDLVLDADRDELGYLKDCSNTYENVTLHLNKSFTKDKWNGFVLPVNLTRDQLTQAFGPNVRLAKLSKVTDTEIQFTSIDVTAQANDAVVMQAYIPYIIFPTKHLELEKTPAYTAHLSKTGGGATKDVSIAIKKNHIDIPNVSFAIGSDNRNDLSKMNTTNWTTNSNTIVDATTGSPIVGSNNKMTAYGTFVRTFAPTTSGTTDKDNYQDVSNAEADNYGEWHLNNRTIIDGRDDLSDSYFYDNGKMWHAKNNQKRGLRGFSVWFRPTSTTNEAKLMLDGISMDDETTDISQLVYGDEGFGENHSKVEKFANGIYTLQGQLVRSDNHSLHNLPSGIYIVNGKKVVVK